MFLLLFSEEYKEQRVTAEADNLSGDNYQC